MPIRQTIQGKHASVAVYTEQLDSLARKQLGYLADLPIVHHHVAAMPDVHPGMGSTVGSVIPTKGAIIPAAVGVDIGCGMNAVRLSLRAENLPDSLSAVRASIEKAVPVGRAGHREKNWCMNGLNRVVQRTQTNFAKISQDRRRLARADGQSRRRQSLHRALPG